MWQSRATPRRAAEVALFLASDAASFITGQPWRVGPTATLAPWSHRALDGKTAVVTGAARGPATRSTPLPARQNGVRGGRRDRDETRLRWAELDQVARGVEGVAIGADVRDPSLVDQIREAAGDHGVDIYVPNAGVTRDRTLGRMSREEWDLVLDVNLDAVVSSTTELLADGLRPNARVVLVASVGGIAGMRPDELRRDQSGCHRARARPCGRALRTRRIDQRGGAGVHRDRDDGAVCPR